MQTFQRFVTASVLVLFPIISSACDICGCAGGGNSLGLLPLLPKHFVGLRWQAQSYNTIAHLSEPNSEERFNAIDIWGRWHVTPRLQLIGAVPFQFNTQRTESSRPLHINGIGDAQLIVQYTAFNIRTSAWQHTFQIGAGIKLPTGVNNLRGNAAEAVTAPIGLQPGTGSTDILCSGLYALRTGNWGASLDAALRLPGQGRDQFRFGNRLSSNFRIFLNKKSGKTSFLPQIGATLDARDLDRENNIWQYDTGGWALLGAVGLDVKRGNVVYSLGWQHPFIHNMNGNKVTPHARINAGVVYMFGGQSGKKQPEVPSLFPNVNPSSPSPAASGVNH